MVARKMLSNEKLQETQPPKLAAPMATSSARRSPLRRQAANRGDLMEKLGRFDGFYRVSMMAKQQLVLGEFWTNAG